MARKAAKPPTRAPEVVASPIRPPEAVTSPTQSPEDVLLKMLQAILYQLRANGQSVGTGAYQTFTDRSLALEQEALETWNS